MSPSCRVARGREVEEWDGRRRAPREATAAVGGARGMCWAVGGGRGGGIVAIVVRVTRCALLPTAGVGRFCVVVGRGNLARRAQRRPSLAAGPVPTPPSLPALPSRAVPSPFSPPPLQQRVHHCSLQRVAHHTGGGGSLGHGHPPPPE